MILAALFLAGSAQAGVITPTKARIHQLRESIREGKRLIKQAALEQHKGLRLIRERENSDIRLTKASAAQPETIHQALIAVREKYRHESRVLRERRREELNDLRLAIKRNRAEVVVLSGKK